MQIANRDMAEAWDGDEGEEWARDWQRYDRAARGYHRRLLEAAAFSDGDRVLDVGCGNGESTRAAAKASGSGWAVGVDLSSQMLERARSLAALEQITNITFEQADAQVHPFEPDAFDLAISRFGAMFFAEPVAAFANIGAALRPGGRLVLVAWRGVEDNEWLRSIFAALAVGRDLPMPPAGAPGPFGLADPGLTTSRLQDAGYDDVELVPCDERFWLGADTDDAFGHFATTGIVRGMTQGLDDTDRATALDALKQTMAAHDTGQGVTFDSGAWLITATRPA